MGGEDERERKYDGWVGVLNQHVFQGNMETRTEQESQTATNPPRQPPTHHPEAPVPNMGHNKPTADLLGTNIDGSKGDC